MIKHMFVYGVIIPSVVTVLVFIAFLVCWFKFNMRERFFKKIGKQQLCNGVPVANSPVSDTKGIVQYMKDGMDDQDSGRGSSNDPEGSGSTLAASSQRSGTYAPSEASWCGVDDLEGCVCNHARDAGEQCGYANPGLCMTPTEHNAPTLGITHTHDMLVQHTFHFPASECSHINCSAVDSEDGSEEGNYVPFVPITEAFNEEKLKHTCKHREADSGQMVNKSSCSTTSSLHHNHMGHRGCEHMGQRGCEHMGQHGCEHMGNHGCEHITPAV